MLYFITRLPSRITEATHDPKPNEVTNDEINSVSRDWKTPCFHA